MQTTNRKALSALLALAILFSLLTAMPLTAAALLGDIPAPVITNHPVNRTVDEGGSTTFSVTATGINMKYQWQYYTGTAWTSVSNNPPRFTGADTEKLSMTDIGLEYNNMRLRCVVTGSSGPALNPTTTTLYSNEVLLTVTPADPAIPTYYIGIGGMDHIDIATNQNGTGWDWIASSKTLTLTSAYTGEPILIKCAATDTVSFEYSGNITITNNVWESALYCEGNLNVAGSGGTLTLNSPSDYGLSARGRIIINSGTFNIYAYNNGIEANSDITINGGTITISTADEYGMYGIYSYDDGNVTISGGTITIRANQGGISVADNGNVTISGGTLMIISYDSGITTGDGNVTISGGTLAIDSSMVGIGVQGNLTINGGSGTIITSEASSFAVLAYLDLAVGSGMQVKSWDGAAYTVSPAIGTVTVYGDDSKTFVNPASPTTGLRNIQFGPAAAPPPVTPFPFTDVPAAAWYYNDVKTAWEQGLINGKTATLYAPDDNLSYSEAVKLAACMHELYTTGSVTLANGSPNWYDSYVTYAKNNGIIDKDYNWNAPATRAGYMEIFANALPDEAFAPINTIADGAIPDVPMAHPQAAAIYKLYRAGILQGADNAHNCDPGSNIKRSEVAAILTRMMNTSARISFII